MSFKKKLHAHCQQLINIKIRELENILIELSQGAQNDSKSSAGDKHETARAMMQIEHEKTSRQLSEAIQLKKELEKINPEICSASITKGSLIRTNKGYLYLSIALGKIELDSVPVIVMSIKSPLSAKLMGLSKGACAEINEVKYTVLEIN